MIDTTYARRAPLSGTGVYIRRVCEELRHFDGVELLEAANEQRRPPGGGGVASVRNLTSDLWWTNVGLPRRARAAGAEVLHHPLPARALGSRIPQVVTVVDVAFERLPGCFDRGYRAYAHATHRAAALAAGAVICISETTAQDVRALWGVSSERIAVALLGPGQELGPDAAGRPRSEDPTYFLYVGDDEPRKNLPTLLAAYGEYRQSSDHPLGLVLAGSARATGPGIRLERAPGPRRLAELYAGAAALVQPSLYEGFGLTALEAMSLGVPVLAARAPGLVEVCADAVRYAEPSDAGAFAQALGELDREPGLRASLSQRGRRRAEDFTWAACASAHLGAYSLALERR